MRHDQRGERNPNRKLSEQQGRQIREHRAQGVPINWIARQFNTTKSRISLICSRKSWKHLS